MDKIIWIFVVLLTGMFLPVQVGLNTRLGKLGGSPAYASLISFVVGCAALLGYVLLSRQSFSWQAMRDAPLYVWMGGIIGAVYVTVTIFAFPRLGPGLTFGLIVAGQMISSVWLEHQNVLVAHPSPVNWMKGLGVLLIICGVLLIRRSGQ